MLFFSYLTFRFGGGIVHKKSPLDTRQFYWREENGEFAEGEFEGFPTNSSLLKLGYEFS